MIRKFRISVDKFVYWFTAPHKRDASWLKLCNVLLSPFRVLMDEYIAYRDDAIIRANVTNETMSIEWYLNYKFDSVQQRIYIITNYGDGVNLGLRDTEPTDFIPLGLRDTEPTDFYAIPLRGESSLVGDADFAVFIPASLSSETDAIKGVLKNYCFYDKRYNIKTF